jgi:predicted nuclease of predicted toxin-antitoxin system
MKVLLDECIPRKLKSSLPGHECRTVPEEGLAGKKNGELLTLAERSGFEVFLTLDRGIEYQQNLLSRSIAVILIRTKSSRLADLLPHVPELLRVLGSIQPGQLVKLT